MQQYNKTKGIKGIVTLYNEAVRFRYMITEQAKERCRILAFWEHHGLAVTKEAFQISRATLFRWQKALKEKQGVLPEETRLSYYAKTDTFREKIQIKRKKLRSKGHEGGLVKADSIVRFTNGIKRYIITAIDQENKFAFAYAYKNHSSDGATDFMKKFQSVAPLSLTHVQTDNGSEFAKHFEIYL